jgi:hypothetical protein
MQAVAGVLTLAPPAGRGRERRASPRVIAAVAAGIVVLSAVFTVTGGESAEADGAPGSGVVLEVPAP